MNCEYIYKENRKKKVYSVKMCLINVRVLSAAMLLLIVTISFKVTPTLQEKQEVYEAEEKICNEKCACRNESVSSVSDSFILDCTNKSMIHILNKWPPHETHHLIATFSWNNFSELQQIPYSQATTISLSFSHCGIRTLESALFIDAGGIQYLDLSWNQLTGQEIHADVFRGRYNNKEYEPISLQQLDISHNQIESLSAKVFEHTPNVTRLNLNHNPLKIIDMQTAVAISSLIKLSALNLAHTAIETFDERMVSRLNKLRELDLSENHFKIVPAALAFLGRNLEILKLGENPIEHFYDESFMGLHSLRELNISGLSELKTIRHNTFSTLTNLRVLNCSNNPRLYHIHYEAFGKANKPPIKELYLSENNLKTIYVNQLNWQNLSVLDLAGNRWLCDCELYHTFQLITKSNNDVETPIASCSLPLKYSGIELDDIRSLERACNESMTDNKLFTQNGPHIVFMKVVLVFAIFILTCIGFWTLWKIMRKYNSIRSINTLYPVMYVSASTVEH